MNLSKFGVTRQQRLSCRPDDQFCVIGKTLGITFLFKRV